MSPETKQELARFFDHTQLAATATEAEIRQLCQEAVHYGFFGVCIQPRWVGLCADLLHTTGVRVVTVTGFPLGAETTRCKAYQTQTAIQDGADEVDMVADLSAIQTGDAAYLRREIAAIAGVCRKMHPPVKLKVIIEAAALTNEQIRFVCEIAQAAGADYIKTSTGFHSAGGAQVEHIRLMAQAAPNCKIKAAGGIKTLAQALAVIDAGASRIGASAAVQIIESFESKDDAAH